MTGSYSKQVPAQQSQNTANLSEVKEQCVGLYKYSEVLSPYKLNLSPQGFNSVCRAEDRTIKQLRHVLFSRGLAAYFSYVRSVTQYDILAWGGASDLRHKEQRKSLKALNRSVVPNNIVSS